MSKQNLRRNFKNKYNEIKSNVHKLRSETNKKCIKVPKIIVFTILFLCIISTCRGGTITGSISFTPTTIRTSSTYTFSIVNSRLLQANEVIQILFPTSDYDFSSQSTTTASKTCTPLTGITSTGISTCTLDKSTNTEVELKCLLCTKYTAL